VGSVLVIGGSSGLEGAAVIAAEAALSFGAGSVAIASPDSKSVVSNTVEFPTFDFAAAPGHVGRFDVVVFGPGLGSDDLDDASKLLADANRVVVDAGGLQAGVVDMLRQSEIEMILTPHSGEFERVAGGKGGTFAIRALARKSGAVVLLKGNPTRISDGGHPVLVNTGGPELATIGTGDVLSGMIAAMSGAVITLVGTAVFGAVYLGTDAARRRAIANIDDHAMLV
jgi:hydroxyethylthiazole kinase-like uncharacterized protein yjeF